MMQLMSDKEDGLVFEESSDAAVEELLADLGVNGGEGVVEEVEVSVSVAGSRQGDSGTLTSRQSNTAIPNQC